MRRWLVLCVVVACARDEFPVGTLEQASTCLPRSCFELGATCGDAPDGCGGWVSCGTCEMAQSCGAGGEANQCGCAPATCEAFDFDCGFAPDGCGGTLACGRCVAPQTCGGGGRPNRCGSGALPLEDGCTVDGWCLDAPWVPGGTAAPMRVTGLWVDGAEEAWVIADGEKLWHRVAAGWDAVPVTTWPGGELSHPVRVNGELWVFGRREVHRFDGSTWRVDAALDGVLPAGRRVHAVERRGDGELVLLAIEFVAGGSDFFTSAVRWDGRAWRLDAQTPWSAWNWLNGRGLPYPSPEGRPALVAATTTPDGRIWGAFGLWSDRRTPIGHVMRLGADGWESVPLGVENLVQALASDAPDRIFAVGNQGLALRWDGRRWRRELTPTHLRLDGVQARSGGVWAIGEKGLVLRRRP